MRKMSLLAWCGSILILGLMMAVPAHAIPSFARQTGYACADCHIGGFGPELTPQGREFKLRGYVGGSEDLKFWGLDRLSAMTTGSFTHTAQGQPGGAAKHYGDNNNFALDDASLFYGGRIYDHLGAFGQVTWDGIARQTSIDNVDIRYARPLNLLGSDLVAGLTLNNNPTSQDLWHTTPAWGFPFASSGLAPTPGAATVIEGTLAQRVTGLGAYLMWNDLVYAEITGYSALPKTTQDNLGLGLDEYVSNKGIAPYWRLALQKTSDQQAMSIGTYGLYSRLYPGGVEQAGTDDYHDAAIDAQYQYLGDGRHIVGLYAAYIREDQNLDASKALGATANSHGRLETTRLTASYHYLNTYGGALQFFQTTGSHDALLYTAGAIDGFRTASPNSRGYQLQLDLTPFGKENSWLAPWLNTRLALLYTHYVHFNGSSLNYDGSGRDASDNDTIFLSAWFLL